MFSLRLLIISTWTLLPPQTSKSSVQEIFLQNLPRSSENWQRERRRNGIKEIGQSWLDLWAGEWVSEWWLVEEVVSRGGGVRSRWFESKKRIWSYSEHNLNQVPPRIGQLEAKRIYPSTAHPFLRLTCHHRGKTANVLGHLDSIAVSLFVNDLVEFDKYWQ